MGVVLELLGQADFKTVPGFAFRATFEGCIEGFTLLQVLLATTVYGYILNNKSKGIIDLTIFIHDFLQKRRNLCSSEIFILK